MGNLSSQNTVSVPFQDTAGFKRITWKFVSWFSLATLGISRLGAEPTRGKIKIKSNTVGSVDWKDLASVFWSAGWVLYLLLGAEWTLSWFQRMQLAECLGFSEVNKIAGGWRSRKQQQSLPSHEWKQVGRWDLVEQRCLAVGVLVYSDH